MSLTVTGTVSQSVPISGVVTLTFTDTTTGVGTLTSRILNIYDANSVLLDTINMGAELTATYAITADKYLVFSETIVDNTGTYTGAETFTSSSFYISVFVQDVVGIVNQCADTFGVINNLVQAELYKNAALAMALFGQGVNSQILITQANFRVRTPYYA